MSDGRRREEIDTWIGKANVVLRELYRSVAIIPELSKSEIVVDREVFQVLR